MIKSNTTTRVEGGEGEEEAVKQPQKSNSSNNNKNVASQQEKFLPSDCNMQHATSGSRSLSHSTATGFRLMCLPVS